MWSSVVIWMSFWCVSLHAEIPIVTSALRFLSFCHIQPPNPIVSLLCLTENRKVNHEYLLMNILICIL